MNARTSRRLLCAMVAAAGWAAAPAHAQLVNWATGSGLWSNPANWVPAGVPNSPAALVLIGVGGDYTVGIDMSASVGSLTLSNPTGRAALYNGRSVHVQGTGGISNDSTLTVNPTAETSGTVIRFDVDAPLSGTGVVVLNASSFNIDTAVIANANSATVTHGVGHTIRGTGRITAPMANAGLIVADRSGLLLELLGGAKTNTGVLKATGSGILALNSAVSQSGGGTVQADGGTVSIGNITITGGQVDVKNSGVVRAYNSTFDSVVAAGTVEVPNGYTLSVAGSGFAHDGTLTINPTAETSGTRLLYTVPGPLSGSGTVVLNANAFNPDTAYISSTGGSLITLSSGHTVRGAGRIYAPLTNNGLIIADRSGLPLQLLSTGKTNNNIIRAIDGSYLDVIDIGIVQSGSLIADGATLRLYNATVDGGNIVATGGGLTQVIGGVLTDVTLDGPTHIINGHTLVINGSALTNNGTVTVNPTAETSGTVLRYDSTALLTGSGSVVLNANAFNLDTAYVSTTGTTCTQDVNHTIRGTGRIYAGLINNGTIAADATSRVLEFLGSAKTNNALISATNGSTLWINAPLTQNVTGVVQITDATLGIGNTSITGGQINAIGTGVVRVNNSTLNTATVNAPIEVPNGYSLYIAGSGFTHNGTITVNPTEETSGTQIRFDSTIALAGAGDIVLRANAFNLDTAIVQTSGANLVTIPAARTIRGTGSILGALTNDGLIAADRNGRTLRLASAIKTNNATMKATGGGLLLVSSGVDNTQGQFIADGGNIVFEGVSILGGQVHAANGGGVAVYGTTFTDTTSDAPIQVVNGYSMYVQGPGFTNNGTITVNPTAETSGTALRFESSGVLGGSGQVILNANAFNFDTAMLYPGSASPMTIGAAQAIRGHGRMMGNFVLQGKIAPGIAGGPAWRIQADSGSIVMTPSASLDFDIQNGQWDTLTGSDAIMLNGTLNVAFAYTPTGAESFDLITGSSITGRFTSINITGAPTSGMQVIYTPTAVRLVPCYANCDLSTAPPMLNINDFMCFLNKFAAVDPAANCDNSTAPPVLNVNDFMCFINRFAAGCQ